MKQTDKILIDRAVVEQVLEVLELNCTHTTKDHHSTMQKSIEAWNALRQALEAEQQDESEQTAVCNQMADILSRTAIALKGPEPELTKWSWHDLPDLAISLTKQHDEPYAYAVYFPDQPNEELVHDLDDLCDEMTNREHSVVNRYTNPQPRQPLTDEALSLIGSMVSELRAHRYCGDCYPENGWPDVNKVLADYAAFKRAHGIGGEK